MRLTLSLLLLTAGPALALPPLPDLLVCDSRPDCAASPNQPCEGPRLVEVLEITTAEDQTVQVRLGNGPLFAGQRLGEQGLVWHPGDGIEEMVLGQDGTRGMIMVRRAPDPTGAATATPGEILLCEVSK